MVDESLPEFWMIALAAIGLLAGFIFLRVLASYRESEIAAHDTAREARRIRAEYEAKKSSPEITV